MKNNLIRYLNFRDLMIFNSIQQNNEIENLSKYENSKKRPQNLGFDLDIFF